MDEKSIDCRVTVIPCEKLLLTSFGLFHCLEETWQSWHSRLLKWRNSQVEVNKSLFQSTMICRGDFQS